MPKHKPFLIAPWPYVGDGLGKEPRYTTLKTAEAAARNRLKDGGDWLNIVEEQESGRVILATVSCDASGNVWTNAEVAGSTLL